MALRSFNQDSDLEEMRQVLLQATLTKDENDPKVLPGIAQEIDRVQNLVNTKGPQEYHQKTPKNVGFDANLLSSID